MDFKKKTEKLGTPPSNYPTIQFTRRSFSVDGLSNVRLAQGSASRSAERGRRAKEGLTLVELLIGMAILAFISLMVASVYLAHFRLFSNQSTNIDVASQNRIALDEMTNQIREAASVYPAGDTVTGCSDIDSDSNSIVLALWPLDTSTGDPYQPASPPENNITLWDRVVYCVDTTNKTLKKAVQPRSAAPGSKRTSSTKILATNLAPGPPDPVPYGLVFSNLANPVKDTTSVTIRLKILSKNYDKKFDIYTDQTGKAVLRNK